ncbi:MAG: MarC family protein [Opitutales bacterium]
MQTSVLVNFVIALLAITNPFDKVPLWNDATRGESFGVRWRVALGIVGASFLIIGLFLWFGEAILGIFSLDLAAFKVGGGIVLAWSGIETIRGTIMPDLSGEHTEGDEMTRARVHFHKVVVPLAMPIIAGPGAVVLAVLYGTSVENGTRMVMTLALFLILLVVGGMLLAGKKVEKAITLAPLRASSRLFGLVLVALAAQLSLEGFAEVFPQWLDETSPLYEANSNSGDPEPSGQKETP